MKLLKGLIIALLVLVVGLTAVGFLLPDTARVSRSTIVAAKPATVYTVLNGFHQFNRWSPWADLDPNAVFTLEGPPQGVGARAQWSSADPNVGSGSQEIIETTPPSRIRIKLTFEGFKADSASVYELSPEGEGTRVEWIYESVFHGNLLNRYFGLLLDDMIGNDYDKGLARLKAFVESLPQEDFTDAQPQLVRVPTVPLVTTPGQAAAEQAGPVLREAYARLGRFLQASGRKPVGAPLAITREYDEQTRFWKFDAALPIDQPCTTPAEGGDILCHKQAETWAVRVVHRGPYSGLEPAYRKLVTFKTVAGLRDNGNAWQRYVNSPSDTAASGLETEIYWPVK